MSSEGITAWMTRVVDTAVSDIHRHQLLNRVPFVMLVRWLTSAPPEMVISIVLHEVFSRYHPGHPDMLVVNPDIPDGVAVYIQALRGVIRRTTIPGAVRELAEFVQPVVRIAFERPGQSTQSTPSRSPVPSRSSAVPTGSRSLATSLRNTPLENAVMMNEITSPETPVSTRDNVVGGKVRRVYRLSTLRRLPDQKHPMTRRSFGRSNIFRVKPRTTKRPGKRTRLSK